MIEKISHVRNPLTVIAMFAALAEVSGTIVLPILDKETQAVFVWFLILFPCILVGSFFGTLLFKHHVLYAPSDYKDEKFFFDLFSPADKTDVIIKLNSESEADYPLALPNDADTYQGDTADIISGVNDPGSKAIDVPESNSEALPPRSVRPPRIAAMPAKESTAFGLAAARVEDLVVSRIEGSLGFPLRREVSPSGMPGTVFDAVGESNGRSVIVEARYTRVGHLQTAQLEALLLKVEKFWTGLPENIRAGFQLIYVVVVDGSARERVGMMRKNFMKHTKYYPYKIRFIMIDIDQLEQENIDIMAVDLKIKGVD